MITGRVDHSCDHSRGHRRSDTGESGRDRCGPSSVEARVGKELRRRKVLVRQVAAEKIGLRGCHTASHLLQRGLSRHPDDAAEFRATRVDRLDSSNIAFGNLEVSIEHWRKIQAPMP